MRHNAGYSDSKLDKYFFLLAADLRSSSRPHVQRDTSSAPPRTCMWLTPLLNVAIAEVAVKQQGSALEARMRFRDYKAERMQSRAEACVTISEHIHFFRRKGR